MTPVWKASVYSLALLFTACTTEEVVTPEIDKKIIHKTDGRTVRLSDALGIAPDINADGFVDFNIFIELTANGSGDRLFVGINPIGANTILAEPPNDDNFLNMGLARAIPANSVIPESPSANLSWTPDYGALVIRNTPTTGTVWYEGDWSSGTAAFLPIRLSVEGVKKYGWLKVSFNKQTEAVTLEEYAYSDVADLLIAAGEK